MKKILEIMMSFAVIIILTTSVANGLASESFTSRKFTRESSLMGTAITIERNPPIERDLLCILKLSGCGDGFVNFSVNVNGLLKLQCSDVPVIWEITRTPSGKVIITLDISDYTNRVYINIRILDNCKGRVHLSTWVPTAIYYLCGEIEDPRIFGYVNQRVAFVDDTFFEQNYNMAKGTEFKVFRGDTSDIITPYREDTAAYYGLVHEIFFDQDNNAPEQVPGWLVQGTCVKYGVYVEAPTEATIKSDLQYYNYYCYFGGPQRVLVGYEIDTHGADIDEPDKPLLGADWSWLYPDEVRNLWKKDVSYVIKPQDTVILADACRSLWDSDENIGSEMASAWVDLGWPGYTGAAAYIGSTINVPVTMDAFTTEFWQSLCFQEETVGKAVSDALAARGLSSTAFQVYGRSDFRIPN